MSISTVSKALNGVDVVKEETKSRIVAAANELHYVPNLMGKQLKTGKTKMLGFYTTSVSGPYFNLLIDEMAQEAQKLGYGMNVFISNDKQVVLNSIMGGVVDGIIGFEDLIDVESLQAIKREKIKAVFIDRDVQSETISSITFNSREAGKKATKYLLEMGHEKIAFLKGHAEVYDSEERFKGYCEVLSDYQIPLELNWILTGLFEEQTSFEAIINFFNQHKGQQPTAFLAGNDLSAIGTIKALNYLGYSVPQDYSVVGFDDIELLEYFKPRLTTVHNPIKRQGKLAVNELVKLIKEEKSGRKIVLDSELIIRESVHNNNHKNKTI